MNFQDPIDQIIQAENPVKELVKLYVKFHEEAEKDEALNDQGRYWFKKLEDGDSITIVYPKGRPMSAQFTEFDFSIWKPSVPRAWGFILMTLLTIAWFPAKSLFLRIRRI